MNFIIVVAELMFVAWATVAVLRFLLQKGGLAISHPLARLCAQVTDFAVKPARALLKPVRGWDGAALAVSFVAILLCEFVLTLLLLFKGAPAGWRLALWLTVNSLLLWSKAVAYALILCLVAQTVLSFSDPYNPLARAVNDVLRPLTRPFKMLRAGNVDFSGTVIFIALWLWIGWIVPNIQFMLLHRTFP